MADLHAPLQGIRVLDFTTLLPGPLATLILAEAGATVVKVERPPGGDPGRGRAARAGEPIEFALINRGKKSVVLDLKSQDGLATARRLASEADVLVEQFRPGVMVRLGCGYEDLSKLNPRLIYCSISGYGQDGPLAQTAGHDINYSARSGMLSQSVDQDGRPVLPQGQIADLGGGTYPAVINILLALQQRHATGRGCYIDVAMAENTLTWMRNALAPVFVDDAPIPAGRHSHTGGSPRYGIYMTADRVALAVAPLEESFWQTFCDIIELDAAMRDRRADADTVRHRVAERLATRSAVEWMRLFEGRDVCVEIVQDAKAVMDDPHFKARGVFARQVELKNGRVIPALPVPLSRHFLSQSCDSYPSIGSTDPAAVDLWERA
jgi:alpha-methylacyl-CoA racemase